MELLTTELITFGKYKGFTLGHILKDRSYCNWLIEEEWFRNGYEYLYNRIKEYDPKLFFFKKITTDPNNFLQSYHYFNLYSAEEVQLPLNQSEKISYEFYLQMIDRIKCKIFLNLENDVDNPYDIKAPTHWLKEFEQEQGIPRDEFKTFLASYELDNIPYIIERIKKEGGIEYKGAKSFIIAKKRSEEQEKWWEEILKLKYGENLGTQFKFQNCIFDFINISTDTIFECKLALKDFNKEQHNKYKLTLKKYRIIYLIANNAVIDMERENIYTTDPDYYNSYITNIHTLKKPTYLDLLIQNFSVIQIDDISTLFGTT